MHNKQLIGRLAVLMAAAVLSANCKKSGGPPLDNSHTIKVLEYKTAMPVEGADVMTYYEHSNYMSSIFNKMAFGNTDAQGAFSFDPLNINVITASHPKYWYTGVNGIEDIMMIPKATLQLHIVKTGIYDDHTRFELQTKTTELLTDPFSQIYLGSYSLGIDFWQREGIAVSYLPADTTIYMSGMGNCNNYISWDVFTGLDIKTYVKTGETSPQFVNRFDTVSVNINY